MIIKESTSSMAKCQLIIKDFTATCLDLPVPIPLAFFIYFQGAILWWKWKIMCPPDKSRSTKSWVCKIKREMMTYHQYRSKLKMLSVFYTLFMSTGMCLKYDPTLVAHFRLKTINQNGKNVIDLAYTCVKVIKNC